MIELMIVVAILGILAAIAIPALSRYIHRSKTTEAKVQLSKMFDSAAAYFAEEHVERGSVRLLGGGGGVSDSATHMCPTADPSVASLDSGMTPALALSCNNGPGGRCIPGDGSHAAGYDFDDWNSNAVWLGLNFQMAQPHFFHYNFLGVNSLTGHGACIFTAQAFGDLDDDGTYSTFERAGAADEHGVNGAAGLYVQLELE